MWKNFLLPGLLFVVLFLVSSSSFAQPVPPQQIQFGSADPTGQACPSTRIYVRVPQGTVYTCQNGMMAASGGGGSGTVSVVGSGSLCSACLVTGGGTTTIQTPNSSAEMDSSGNVSTPGTVVTGVGGSVAGALSLVAGTLPSIGSNIFGFVSPTTVTTSQWLRAPNTTTSAHSTLIIGAPSSNVSDFAYKVLPDCPDVGGNHINFTQSTDAYSCGTSGGGGSAGLDPTSAKLVDEFTSVYNNFSSTAFTGFGELHWAAGDAGAVALFSGINPYTAQQAGYIMPGLLRLDTPTSANGSTTIHLAGYSFNAPWFYNAVGTTNWEFQWALKYDANYSTQYIAKIGLVDAVSVVPNNGIWFGAINNAGCSTTGSDTTWQYISRAASTSTTNNSAVTITSGHLYRFRLRSTSVGTILFSVSDNGGAFTSETAVTTNIPTVALAPEFQIISCDGNPHSLFADYFGYYQTGLVR